MTQPRFLADHNLNHRIVKAARRLEPVLVFATALDLGLSKAEDGVILEFAHQHGWLVVSHDVNTMKGIAAARIAAGAGIAGLFLAPAYRKPRAIAESLVLIWAASSLEEWKDRLVYLPL